MDVHVNPSLPQGLENSITVHRQADHIEMVGMGPLRPQGERCNGSYTGESLIIKARNGMTPGNPTRKTIAVG